MIVKMPFFPICIHFSLYISANEDDNDNETPASPKIHLIRATVIRFLIKIYKNSDVNDSNNNMSILIM